MNRVVVDASVVLAVIHSEAGWEALLNVLDDAVVSSVNLAEVQSKLVGKGMPPEAAWASVMNTVSYVSEFDQEQARVAGDLILKTRERSLSMGDRACLALGITLGLPVYTTDRAWKALVVGAKVHVIR